jgi:hypothetical protein
VLVQDRCMVCTEYTIGIEIVLDSLDGLIGDEAQVEGWFGLFGGMLLLMRDWCMVCIERTVGLETVMVVPDGTPS